MPKKTRNKLAAKRSKMRGRVKKSVLATKNLRISFREARDYITAGIAVDPRLLPFGLSAELTAKNNDLIRALKK